MISKYQQAAVETARRAEHTEGRRIAQFAAEEDGVMVVFSMFVILMILMVAGIGVDTMRFEMERTRLQNTIDRAVLAAADLDQTLSPKEVVEDYFVKAGISDVVPTVTPTSGIGYKTVSAAATRQMDTQFMRMSGVDTMTIPAGATAEERVPNVEISLVVDVSGSMNQNNRLTNLKVASTDFVDIVLQPDTAGRTSVNFVPYSEQVNIGSDIMTEFVVNRVHNYSHCVEFDDTDFDETRLKNSKTYKQMQHFQWNYYSIESGSAKNTIYDTVCPRNTYETVRAMTQNKAVLFDQINSLKPRAGTAIHMGMKWGVGLLDPSFQEMNSRLSGAGITDAAFANRPVPYTDTDTLKTIVLMTDGENSDSYRIHEDNYATPARRAHWDRYNFQYYLLNYVKESQRSQWYVKKYYRAHSDLLLSEICTLAKSQGIVIWTIGFETTEHGNSVMKQCASSPSHFFDVEGIDIRSAFQSIARQINQLRLTQ